MPSTIAADPTSRLTLAQLESHLWGAADILRGSIDSADYKHYIFGLLFFKRLSDVWEEEYDDRLARYGDAELAADPDEHRFHIPEGAFWRDVRRRTSDIGHHLNAAPEVDFNNKERFPDATLERLLQHFEKYRLRRCDVEPDMLGHAYEYLIAQFADDAGKNPKSLRLYGQERNLNTWAIAQMTRATNSGARATAGAATATAAPPGATATSPSSSI